MKSYEKLILNNKSWSLAKTRKDPNFFKKLAKIQTPDYLWIGCSDSRVPANEITGTTPGEMFVHRNIANLVVNEDINLLSVLEYAVNYLKVKHIIVCGHYGCGGVEASMTNNSYGIINKWIANIKDVYIAHKNEIESIKNPKERFDKLVELNVYAQVQNLMKTSIIQNAWKKDNRPDLHGWVYGLDNGVIHRILEIKAKDTTLIDPLYIFKNP